MRSGLSSSKEVEFVQQTLRGPKSIIKYGGHVTKEYADRKYRFTYDNKRVVLIPTEYQDAEKSYKLKDGVEIDFASTMFYTRPGESVEEIRKLRNIFAIPKTSAYSQRSGSSVKSVYKDYTELAIRSFIKGSVSTPPKFNLPGFENYEALIEFIKEYLTEKGLLNGSRKRLVPTKQRISNLKVRMTNQVIKTVPRTPETEAFVEYVKNTYKDFDDQTFLDG